MASNLNYQCTWSAALNSAFQSIFSIMSIVRTSIAMSMCEGAPHMQQCKSQRKVHLDYQTRSAQASEFGVGAYRSSCRTRKTKKKSAGKARTGMAFRGLSLANGSTLHQHQNGKLLAERTNHPSSRRLPHLYRQT